MDKEQIFGMIIMALCCFGCGALFLGIGISCKRSEKPATFWSGSKLLPEQVSNLQAYNQSCATMWKRYSIGYFIAGILSCLTPLHEYWLLAGAAVLILLCFFGIPLLIIQYQRIAKSYIFR